MATLGAMRSRGAEIALALFVCGCDFRVPSIDESPRDQSLTEDLSSIVGSDDAGAPDDLTVEPPDLSPPPPDLTAPPCVEVAESFAVDPTARWTLMGDASYDTAAHRLQVTSLGNDVSGSAFFTQALRTPSFDATFTFRINDGSGADGLAFVFAKAANAAALTPFGGHGQVNLGYGLGYLGMNGFAVELDTFNNLTNGDPNDNHVAFIRATDGAHLLVGTPAQPALHSDKERQAHVRFTGTRLLVEIDGGKVIEADLPSGATFTADDYYFGFTGASGGANDRHTVTNFKLIVGAPVKCFP
jgi:hypothetical protein